MIEKEEPAQHFESVTRAALMIALGNLLSRILGLVREIVKSNLFGAGGTVDAFNVAARVPLLLYDLLIGGMVNSALIPVFASYATQSRTELWKLASVLLNIIVVIMAIMVILLQLFTPQIAIIFSGGSSPEVLELTTQLLRITVPALMFLSIGGVVSALLYALKQFAYPAMMAAVFNGTIVILTLMFFRHLGITVMALGLLVGSVTSALFLLIGLRTLQGHYHFIFTHAGFRQVMISYLPIILGLLVEVLVSKPVTYHLASQAGAGRIAWMDYATTLWQFPQGLVATAVSFAILPTLSTHAATENTGHSQLFRQTLDQGLSLIIVLIVPSAVALFVLANPIVALLFEHGNFTSYDTAMTGLALRLYLIGLPFHALDLLLVFAFYARKNTRTPALIGVSLTAGYILFAIILMPAIGFFGIMVAESIRIALHVVISAWILGRLIGGGSGKVSWTLLRVLLLAGLMGGVMVIALHVMSGLHSEVLTVFLPALLGGVVYLTGIWLSGIEELNALWSLIRTRMRGNRQSDSD